MQLGKQFLILGSVTLVLLASGEKSNGLASRPAWHAQVLDDDIRIGYGLAFGRVDDDPHTDILLADQQSIVWYENPGRRGFAWKRHTMATDLTRRDNVCIAARDLDGDGLVEVAVGAMWNPGETSDAGESGAVFVLQRPENPRGRWPAQQLAPHAPTTHRMRWARAVDGWQLLVLPLHGVGNRAGQGTPVAIDVYRPLSQTERAATWPTSMHMTHNFDLIEEDGPEKLLVAGAEGIGLVESNGEIRQLVDDSLSRGVGEVRQYTDRDVDGAASLNSISIAAIEPMHGNQVVLYQPSDTGYRRTVLDSSLNQGHGLAAADLTGDGNVEIVAGWRNPDAEGKVGLRIYQPTNGGWTTHSVDDSVACEDLKVVDLDQDGRLDIIAAGRATRNLVLYWNDSAETNSN